jgi:hypothetical protein
MKQSLIQTNKINHRSALKQKERKSKSKDWRWVAIVTFKFTTSPQCEARVLQFLAPQAIRKNFQWKPHPSHT